MKVDAGYGRAENSTAYLSDGYGYANQSWLKQVSRHTPRLLLVLLLLLIASPATALAEPPPASVSQPDELGFFRAVESMAFTKPMTNNRKLEVLTMGYGMCYNADRYGPIEYATTLVKMKVSRKNMMDQFTIFGAAMGALCPEHLLELNKWINTTT